MSSELYTCDSDDSKVRSFEDVYVNTKETKTTKTKKQEKKIDDTPSLFE